MLKTKNMEKTQMNPDAYAISEAANCMTLQRVLNVVCQKLDVNPLDVQSKTHKKRVVKARHYYFYLAYRTRKKNTIVEIAKFVNRDHSTAIAGRNKISGYMDVYPDVLKLVMEMRAELSVEKGDAPFKRVNPDEQIKINKLHVGYYNTPEKIAQLKTQIQST